MFEAFFRKAARFSSKHSTAVIIVWVVALIALAPFSSLFLSNTSYDLGGSIVPSNSMAQKASNLQSQYFNSAAGPGTNDSALLIVTKNTSVTDSAGSSGLVSLQQNLTSYFKTVRGFKKMTTAFTLENQTLYNFTKGLKAEMNSTYSLISSINRNMTSLNNSIQSTIGLIYGLPELYLQNFTKNFNESDAYNATMAQAAGSPESVLYVNTFAAYFNKTYVYTIPIPSNPVPAMSTSINDSLYNSNSNFSIFLHNQGQQLASIVYPMNANYSFDQNLSQVPPWDFIENYTITTFSSQLGSNSTLSSFLNNNLNLTVDGFLNRVYTLGKPATGDQILNLLVPMIYNGTEYTLKGNPLIRLNPQTLSGYLTQLNSTGNVSTFVRHTMHEGNFGSYPVVPTSYVFHQFVGFDNSTTIMIATFSVNYSISVVNKVNDITSNYGAGMLPSSSYYVAGTSALTQQLSNEILNGMVRALIIGIALSVIIVGLFFRSPLAAFVPLGIFGFSTVMSMGLNGLIYKYIFHTSISFITPTLLLILILGLTSDYVVYIMSRYRQEKRRGNPEAVLEAGQWAGHAVFTSGITVALSYVVLWASNIPVFSDSGLTNAIGVGISIALANSFLIAILHKTGTKLYWPSNITHAEKFPFEKSMTSVSHLVRNNRKKILVAFLVVTFLGSYVYLITPTNMNVYSLVPASSGIKALEVVNSSFHGDFFDRSFIIMKFASPLINNGTYNMSEMRQVTSVESSLISHGEVTQVYGPTYPYGNYVNPDYSGVPSSYNSTYRNQTKTFIGGPDHNYVMITFQLATLSWENKASNFLREVPSIVNSSLQSSSPSGKVTTTYYIGGQTQSLNDAYSYTSATFLKMVPVLLIAIFIILLIQLSSVFTPARLIAMVVSSVVVALAIVFAIIHYAESEPILIFLPLFTFITLLAVGLDYDIFMVTRVREEVMKGKTNEDATMISIRENGGVIVTLGMLLFVTFGALYLSGIGIMQEIGLGLALGVLVDTFISWPFFVPTIMMLMRKYNWWPSKVRGD